MRLLLGGVGGLGAVRTAASVAAVASVGGVAYVRTWRPPPDKRAVPHPERLVLPRPVSEAVAGGLGEFFNICCLYPLEALKVRCQAQGLTSAAVLKGLLAQGGLPATVAALYAGWASAAACSLVVGAVHYASFAAAKRAAEGGSSSGSSGSGSSSGGAGNATASTNLVAALAGAVATALVESPAELFRHQAQAGVGGGNFLRAMADAVRQGGPGALWAGTFLPFLLESLPYDIAELSTYGQLQDALAAARGRHLRDDEVEGGGGGGEGAGSGSGSSSTRRRRRRRRQDAPHAADGGGGGNAASSSSGGSSRHGGVGDAVGAWLAAAPESAADAAAGAAAGVAAVLVSMPFDVVKTRMQTHAELAAVRGGAAAQLAAFLATGGRLVDEGGVGALFTGTVPRLLQVVPSTCLCWTCIERAQGFLEPYTKP